MIAEGSDATILVVGAGPTGCEPSGERPGDQKEQGRDDDRRHLCDRPAPLMQRNDPRRGDEGSVGAGEKRRVPEDVPDERHEEKEPREDPLQGEGRECVGGDDHRAIEGA